MKPRLIVGSKEFEVAPEGVTIGRDPSNTIALEDDRVSSFHCKIEVDQDRFLVVDRDSLNGTYINGWAVTRAFLQSGDQIRVGRTPIDFFTRGAERSRRNSIRLEEGEKLEASTTVLLNPSDSVFLRMNAGSGPKLDRMARDMSVLLRLNREINEIDDSEELQKTVLAGLFEVVPAEDGAIIPVSTRNIPLVEPAHVHRRANQNRAVCISRTIVNSVLESGQSMLRNKLLQDSAAPISIIQAHVQSVLCVPLSVRGTKIGVIYLNTTIPGEEFDQNHLELLTAIAGITSIALEHLKYVEWLEKQNEDLQHKVWIHHDIIGQSPKVVEAIEKISRVAPVDSPVLILGETGTGKELAARAIHENSTRRAGPFVVVNCAAIPETLVESELFGCVKGAFANADRDRKGYIEEADGGTLFLDEIGDLPFQVQPALLRVIEGHEVFRLGSTKGRFVNFRLISATSRPITEESSGFRRDLLMRLGIQFHMPPLRERLEDIPLLVRSFLDKYRHLAQRELNATPPETLQILQAYNWPGNIRELDVVIQHAVVFGKSDRIRPEDLPPFTFSQTHPSSSQKSARKLGDAKVSYERQLILHALEQTRGVVTEAAELLGRVPTYLQRRISQLGLRDELNKIRQM